MRECGELVQVGDSEYSGLAQNTSRSLIICDMCDMCHPDNSACLIICYSLESHQNQIQRVQLLLWPIIDYPPDQ